MGCSPVHARSEAVEGARVLLAFLRQPPTASARWLESDDRARSLPRLRVGLGDEAARDRRAGSAVRGAGG